MYYENTLKLSSFCVYKLYKTTKWLNPQLLHLRICRRYIVNSFLNQFADIERDFFKRPASVYNLKVITYWDIAREIKHLKSIVPSTYRLEVWGNSIWLISAFRGFRSVQLHILPYFGPHWGLYLKILPDLVLADHCLNVGTIWNPYSVEKKIASVRCS